MIKTEIICIWGNGEGANHTLCEKTTAQPWLCQILKGCLNPPGSWLCMWDKTWLGIVPTCIKPAGKGDGLSTADLNTQGEEGQVLEEMLSGTTFPLSYQYCLCCLQPLSGSQWSTRNVEKFVYNLGNDTEAFGLYTNALCSLEVHRIFLWFPG